jgi:hypothetical protein
MSKDELFRKVTRLEPKVIGFTELKEGDLFILEDEDKSVEDGTIINLATGAAMEVDEVETVQCEQVGRTCKLDPPTHPEAVSWKFTAEQAQRDVAHFRDDRNKLLRMIFDAGSLKEVQRDLTAAGYHRLIQDEGKGVI